MKDHKGRARNKAKREYLLSGLIQCAECGSAYVGHTSTNTRGVSTRYYTCGRKYRTRDCKVKNINAEFIETFAVNAVKNFIQTTDFTAAAEAVVEEYNKYKPDLSAERAELQQVKRELQNGVKSVLSGLDFPELRSEIDRLQARKDELDKIIAEKMSYTPAPLSVETVIETMTQSIHAMNNNDIKLLIKKHIQKINAYSDGSFSVIVSVYTNGSSSWARTSDIVINSHALCQLSYRGIC